MKTIYLALLFCVLVSVTMSTTATRRRRHMRNKKVVPFEADKYTELSKAAQLVTDELKATLSNLAINGGFSKAGCLVAPPKGKDSLTRKLNSDNSFDATVTSVDAKGKSSSKTVKDLEKVTDFARSTFVVGTEADVTNAVKKIKAAFPGAKVVKEKDSFAMPTSAGYRDYKVIIEHGKHGWQRPQTYKENQAIKEKNAGVKFEVQIHLCDILYAKEPNHKLYEITRLLELMTPQSSDWNKIMKDGQTDAKQFAALFKECLGIIAQIDTASSKAIEAKLTEWNKKPNDVKLATALNDEISKYTKQVYGKAFNNKNKTVPCTYFDVIDNKTCSFKKGQDEKTVFNSAVTFLKNVFSKVKSRRLNRRRRNSKRRN